MTSRSRRARGNAAPPAHPHRRAPGTPRVQAAAGARVLRRAALAQGHFARRVEVGGGTEAVVGVAGVAQAIARRRDTPAAAPSAGRVRTRRRRRGLRPSRCPTSAGLRECPRPDARVDRASSVSSRRSTNVPPWPRASSQLNSAVLALPTCRCPVGLGAKRTRIRTLSRDRGSRRASGSGLRSHGKQARDESLGLADLACPAIYPRSSNATAWTIIASSRPSCPRASCP